MSGAQAMTPPLPSLFISHGAPTLPLEDIPVTHFLRGLADTLPRPRAILMVSAHWETPRPTLGGDTNPKTIHDFYGFPDALYELAYPAPGAPELAARTAALLETAGFEARIHPRRGLDHGAWNPLMLAYPEADIPVVQLSIQTAQGPAHHLALGRALASLRNEGVLVIGSGNTTHNLGDPRRAATHVAPPDDVRAFDDWLVAAVAEGRCDDLLDYRARAPAAAHQHPTEDHLLPLFVAMGAAASNGTAPQGRLLHQSYCLAILAMSAFAFGGV
ncbi:MAG TPA: class III extradiol ring-cleavage dioxygenase [Alphaproteobacteria bacterium]|nr:class III extradiol ring-cleavage dioxygenase [Alphaproteobacteria bacterium]